MRRMLPLRLGLGLFLGLTLLTGLSPADAQDKKDPAKKPEEKTGDFEWDSQRLNKVVTMSARPQDTEELMNFLYKEMFPDYKPPRG